MNHCQVITALSNMFNGLHLLYQNLITCCLEKLFESNKILISFKLIFVWKIKVGLTNIMS